MDYSLPGSSVHGILQARILGWIAISSCRDLLTQGSNASLLCLLHWQAGSLPLCHLGSPLSSIVEFKLAFEEPFTFQKGASEADTKNEVGGQEHVFFISSSFMTSTTLSSGIKVVRGKGSCGY